MHNDPRAVAQRLADKFRRPVPLAAKAGIIPYKSENGRWMGSLYSGNGWWVGGFWPALR